MNEFKVNDLVIIVKQPSPSQMNAHIHMVGLSGYIEEINGEYAQFHELREDGCGGIGGVPLANLQLVNDNKRLQNLKKAKDEAFEKRLQESRERTKRYQALRDKFVQQAVTVTGVSTRNVIKIFELCEELEKTWDNTEGF